jgi:WD40 repeat protein
VTIEDLDGLANQLGQVLPGANADDDALAVSREGSNVAAYTSHYHTGATVDVWDVKSGRRLARGTFGTGGSTLQAAPRGDGTLAVWAGTRLILWDAKTKTTKRSVDLPGSIDDVAFRADGDAVASVLRPTRPLLWDVGRGVQIATLPVSASEVRLSPDGGRAAASDGKRTWLFDTRSGKRIGDGVTGWLDPSFSPDGRVLAVPTEDGLVHVQDAGNGRAIGSVDVGPSFQIDAVAPSGDGTLLAVVGGTFGGGRLGTERTNELELWDVQRNVVLGSQSLATGLPAERSLDVRFLNGSRRLVTTGFGGVALWDVDPDSWASRACALVHRTLARAEWSTLVGSDTRYDPACRR